MKQPVVKGHPLHAMLSDLPVGALLVSAVLDAIWLAHPTITWLHGAEITLAITLIGAALAALAGLWDWFGIPNDHPAKSLAATHGWTNTGWVVVALASLVVHWQLASVWGPILTFVAVAVAVIAGWLGGDLVFRLGWRVTPAEHAEMLEEQLRKDGQGGRVERVHEEVRTFEREQTLLP